jgi:hypothetical protein
LPSVRSFQIKPKFSPQIRAVFPQLFEYKIPRRYAGYVVNRVRRLRGDEECGLVFHRAFVMMTMTAGGAVSVVTAIMRGRLAVRLRLDQVGRRFRGGLHGCWI